jgi:hypothetical protein
VTDVPSNAGVVAAALVVGPLDAGVLLLEADGLVAAGADGLVADGTEPIGACSEAPQPATSTRTATAASGGAIVPVRA